jgi:hypothetical protein
MIKEIAARVAPTHQTIIKICKFDFAITHLPSHADLRQTPSDISKFYRTWNTERIPESQSCYTSEMRMIQHDYRRAFLSADEASDTLLDSAFFTISIWYGNIPNRKCRR